MLREWTAGPGGIDGLICYNDLWAAAAVRACREAGIDVPGDLTVIGLDDEPFAPFLSPPLTSVSFDPDAMGAMFFRRARALLDGAQDPADPPALRVIHRASP